MAAEHASTATPPGWRVLVVVPTLNEERAIVDVLRQLRRGLPDDAVVRLVVCDGGSTDATPRLVAEASAADPRIVFLHNPQRLQSAAVNLAVQRFGAQFDVLVRCDAHADYPEGFIADLVRSMRQQEADAVVVPMDSIGDGCVRRAVAWVSDTPLGSGGSAHRGGTRSGFVDHGHHAAFRMASFLRAGGYDDTFSHNEDAELDCRQRALGSRLWLDSTIRIGYYPRDRIGALARQYMNYGRGRSRTVRRHPHSLRARQLAVPVHVAMCLLCLAASPWLPWLLAWPGAYVLALLAGSLSIAWRRRSACGLLAGPVAGVMHVAWAWGFALGMLTLREKRWQAADARPIVPDAA